MTATEEKDYYCVITAIYEGLEFISIPILMSDSISDNHQSIESIRYLTERGTTDLTMFKLPIGETRYMIFSRQQLDATLFMIDIISISEMNKSANKKKRKITKKIDSNDENITS